LDPRGWIDLIKFHALRNRGFQHFTLWWAFEHLPEPACRLILGDYPFFDCPFFDCPFFDNPFFDNPFFDWPFFDWPFFDWPFFDWERIRFSNELHGIVGPVRID